MSALFQKNILIASLIVLVVESVISLASELYGFSYLWLSIIPYGVYAGAGFSAADGQRIGRAAFAAGVVAFVEATLGWAIAWHIGPGRPPADLEMPYWLMFASVIVTITLLGSLCGVLGGIIRKIGTGRGLRLS